MIDELESIWQEAVIAKSGYCAGIYLEAFRRTMENFSQHSDRDSNQALPKYKSGTLPLHRIIRFV
jgi:hypothetical protein